MPVPERTWPHKRHEFLQQVVPEIAAQTVERAPDSVPYRTGAARLPHIDELSGPKIADYSRPREFAVAVVLLANNGLLHRIEQPVLFASVL